MEIHKIKQIVEAALVCAEGPLTLDAIAAVFRPEDFTDEEADRKLIREAIKALQADCENRGVELKQVASGYRYQVKQELSPWIGRLWEEKPPRYSRALLETLSLVAYKQPVTRGDIESVRGVSVSTNIMRTLIERDWVKVVGHREVPGRPAMYGTTRGFLDYFNLRSLDELPPLAEIKSLTEPLIEIPEEEQEMAEEQLQLEEQERRDALDADAPVEGFEDQSLAEVVKLTAAPLETEEPNSETVSVDPEQNAKDFSEVSDEH